MSWNRPLRRPERAAFLVTALFGLFGCAKILGIEDLSEVSPTPGTGGVGVSASLSSGGSLGLGSSGAGGSGAVSGSSGSGGELSSISGSGATSGQLTGQGGAAETEVSGNAEGGTVGQATEVECVVGQSLMCYVTPEGTTVTGLRAELDAVGRCRAGRKSCTEQGKWGACQGAVGPAPRDCESDADLDCDGLPDNTLDQVCQCNSSHPTRSCTAANNCAGEQSCGDDHRWQTACTAPDHCDCNPTEKRSCSGGLNNCPGGTQTCAANGTWGACTGAPNHCDCAAGQQRACSAIAGVYACGTASCSAGQWNTSTCKAPVTWCQDQDGDGFCSPNAACVSGCTAPDATSRTSCVKTDCDDTQATVNPNAPLDCTAASSCVQQVVTWSATKGVCECTSTTTAVHEGSACSTYSVCQAGKCNCNSGAACTIECRTGTVNCITAPACKLNANAHAGTACGPEKTGMCNGANVCYSNCTMGNPRCTMGSCVAGSMGFNCLEGSVCVASYSGVGAPCEGTGTCDATATCIH